MLFCFLLLLVFFHIVCDGCRPAVCAPRRRALGETEGAPACGTVRGAAFMVAARAAVGGGLAVSAVRGAGVNCVAA
jgi:hypothetical protein